MMEFEGCGWGIVAGGGRPRRLNLALGERYSNEHGFRGTSVPCIAGSHQEELQCVGYFVARVDTDGGLWTFRIV